MRPAAARYQPQPGVSTASDVCQPIMGSNQVKEWWARAHAVTRAECGMARAAESKCTAVRVPERCWRVSASAITPSTVGEQATAPAFTGRPAPLAARPGPPRS